MKIFLYSLIFLAFYVVGCKSENSAGPVVVAESEASPVAMVSVAYPNDTMKLNTDVTLNAVAFYLLKSDVKANTTGYIHNMEIKLGDAVKKGQTLFVLQTKEARALGNTINQLDKSFQFSGITKTISPATGFVAALNHQIGDYVQDGEVLATVTDANSFGFMVEVPFEYLLKIKSMGVLPIEMPGGSLVESRVAKIMPTADPVSQTVRVFLKTNRTDIPENIIGTIRFPSSTAIGLSVPKMAVLSDETQSNYWVMKLINDSTAVKVPIVRGMETDRFVQIKSGNIGLSDRVITSGNFGLSDTAAVKIQK